jgi:hypothetical protein
MGPGAGSPFKPTGKTPSIWDILTYGKERAGQGMATAYANQGGSPVAQPIPVAVPEAAPVQTSLPISAVATEAVNSGSRAATQAQNEQAQLGLFGNAMSKMFDSPVIGTAVDRLLELAMRPEAQQAQFGDRWFSPLTRAAAGQRLEERAAEQQQQDFLQQLMLAQAKAKPEQMTSVQVQAFNDYKANEETLRTLDAMEKLALMGNASGGAWQSIGAGTANLARAFNFDIPLTGEQEFNEKRASFIATLKSSLGKDLSKADYELLDKFISEAGIFTSSKTLLQNIKDIKERYQRKGTDLKLLTDRMGLSDITSARPTPGVFSRQSFNQ